MTNEKLLLDVAEVANLTGFAQGTIRHFVSQGRIPVVRISARCVRFRRSDIEAWLEQLLVPPRSATFRLPSDTKAEGINSQYRRRLKSAA